MIIDLIVVTGNKTTKFPDWGKRIIEIDYGISPKSSLEIQKVSLLSVFGKTD
jgi:hypothetical protein